METTTERTGGEDLRRSAESTVSTLAEQAQQTADAHLSTQKDNAATALHSVAEAVRDSGQRLRQEQPQIASLADQAAQKVDQASEYIRQHEVRDFVREAENFARREPLLFLGGAFALGFLAARFVKATSPSHGGAQVSGRDADWYAGSSYGAPGRGVGYGATWDEPYRERSLAGTTGARSEKSIATSQPTTGRSTESGGTTVPSDRSAGSTGRVSES